MPLNTARKSNLQGKKAGLLSDKYLQNFGTAALHKQTLKQFIQFTGIGAIGTSGHYLTLIILVEIYAFDPVFATTAGFLLGALINYSLNYRFTFRSKKRHREAMFKFFVVAVIGAVLNSAIMYAGLLHGNVPYLAVQLIATALVLFSNFAMNKAWTFAETYSD